MSNENRIGFPIQTKREGNKITKVCVEDCYRMLQRIGIAEDRSAEKWNEVWDSIDKSRKTEKGELITGCLVVGRGISQPNIKDVFDEEIGNNIAFMKAKLNANMKKRNILRKLWNAAMITIDAIDEEWAKIDEMVAMDLHNLRQYNPEYLEKLDEYGYEVQEEIAEPGSED